MILTGQKLDIDGDFAPANRSPFLENHHGCKIEVLYEGFDSQRMKTPRRSTKQVGLRADKLGHHAPRDGPEQ